MSCVCLCISCVVSVCVSGWVRVCRVCVCVCVSVCVCVCVCVSVCISCDVSVSISYRYVPNTWIGHLYILHPKINLITSINRENQHIIMVCAELQISGSGILIS